jgi:hypothetical protein
VRWRSGGQRSGAPTGRSKRVVAARAAAKAEIENGLADRKRLLSSIKSEIQRLQAEQAARQACSRRRPGPGSSPSSRRRRRG